jgi:hypothetical protein
MSIRKEDVKGKGFLNSKDMLFGSYFKQYFGKIEKHEPTILRMYVLFKKVDENWDQVGFSFPLCGYDGVLWDVTR